MIKAEELRLGNLYYTQVFDNAEFKDVIAKIDSVAIRDAEHYKKVWTGKPIPLTADSLRIINFLCLGKKRNWFDYQGQLNGYYLAINLDGKIAMGRDGKWKTLTYIEPLESIHDLQNWYYWNSGKKELKIDIKAI